VQLLGGLSPRAFLARYWQKQPLLVRGALPGFRDPLSRAQLFQLACDPGVESRLVIERGGARPWELVAGPQDPRRLGRLGARHWTLLVQEADRHAAELAELLERFHFVPRWRVDDVMVSFAAPRGGVGPHADSYDVFLIQGAGRRRWQIQRRPSAALRPGLELRILRGFRADAAWTLEPGDLLYLPPGVAHHGVALTDCFTYSIGFRAPTALDLVLGYMPRVANGADRDRFYRDPDLRPQGSRGEIRRGAIRRLRRMLDAELQRITGAEFDRFIGELLTEPGGARAQAPGRSTTPGALAAQLAAGAHLVRSPASRIAFIRRGARDVDLFVDGRRHPLPPALGFAAPLLADGGVLPAAALLARRRRAPLAALLAELVNAGALKLVRRTR